MWHSPVVTGGRVQFVELEVVDGSIVNLSVEAIVNAANPTLAGLSRTSSAAALRTFASLSSRVSSAFASSSMHTRKASCDTSSAGTWRTARR